MEGWDPFVISGYRITTLIREGDNWAHHRAERAGRTIGAMLVAMAEMQQYIRIVADGTIINSLPLMRNAIESALAPKAVIWSKTLNPTIMGCGRAAMGRGK